MKIAISLLSLVLTTLTCSVGIAGQGDDDSVIKVDSSIVVLNASVTDASGKTVRGLTIKQFRVFEDGAEQEIRSFGAEDSEFAAVILLDSSGSMETRMTLARAAAIEFLNGLRPGDTAAIYNFDSKVKVIQDFSGGRDLKERIFDVKADGTTVLNDAVFEAASVLSKRPEKRRAIVILSDGMDTMSRKSADKALNAALLANATIYSVDMATEDDHSVERNQGQGVLKKFAEKTGGKFVATPGGLTMREAFTRIVAELGTQYTLAFQPSDSKKDGKWHSIEVRVAKPNLTVRTRKGYNASKGR